MDIPSLHQRSNSWSPKSTISQEASFSSLINLSYSEEASKKAMKDKKPQIGYVLLKGLPPDQSPERIRAYLDLVESLTDIVYPHPRLVYMIIRNVQPVYEYLQSINFRPPNYNDREITLKWMPKKPLDLNTSSRVVLVTASPKAPSFRQASDFFFLKNHYRISTIIIREKMTHQAYIEFSDVSHAEQFQNQYNRFEFDKWKHVKVQFLNKQKLVIKNNNMFCWSSEIEHKLIKPQLSISPNPIISPQKQYDLTHKSSSALFLSNFLEKPNEKQIFNLLSLYGNILQMALHNKKKDAFVLYELVEEENLAILHYKGQTVFKATLKIEKVSKAQYLELTKSDYSRKNFHKSDAHSKFPFGERCKTMYPPSTSLFIFNLKDNYDLKKIEVLFSKLEEVISKSFVNERKNNAVFEFCSIKAAINILYNFKNFTFKDDNQTIKINFHHPKEQRYQTENRGPLRYISEEKRF